MQTIFLNKLTSPVRFFAAGTCAVLFVALTLCLSAVPAYGVAPPTRIVATGSVVQIGTMHFNGSGGGWDGGESPLGGTFVIGANGNLIIGDGYSGSVDVFEVTPSGTQTVLASGGGGNQHAAAMDVYGNVYIAGGYGGTIFKLPYNSVTGAYVGYTAAPTANCAGGTSDTAPCVFAPNLQAYNGIAGLAFDGQGNLIIATDYNQYSGASNQKNNNLVLVCNAACQAETDGAGTHAPVQLFSDGPGNTTYMGAIAVDPWGNIFFVDGGNASGSVSNLKEITYTSGVGYASTPSVLESYTSAAGNNSISGLAVGADGTVYFETNDDGIFGIPNSSTGPNVSGAFVVSNAAGGKAIAVDPHGNFAFIPYSNAASADVISYLPTGSFQLGSSALNPSTPLTATATIVDGAGACTPALTLKATQFGATSTDYTAAAGSSCAAALGTTNGTFSPAIASTGGSVISATINFKPTAAGTRNATLTVTDSANNAVGIVALSGTGQGAIANVDPGTVIASLTTGLTNPVAALADPAGDLFVADASGVVKELPAGSSTANTVASGFTSPSAMAFDANGDLFIADGGADEIFEIPNTGTTGAFAAGTKRTLISATTAIGGEPLESPKGLAVGPDGTLYIADGAEARVVAYNPATGVGGLTGAVKSSGLDTPQGLAVDAAGNLYVADPDALKVFIFSAVGVESTLSGVPGITDPVGVAVDASGSVLIADSATGDIVRVPSWNSQSDTAGLTVSQAITVETISPQASSLAMDSTGNYLLVASAGGRAAYDIQRTAASINLGAVADGATNTATVYLENAGNETATLANPDVTQPSDTAFTLTPSGSNPCTAGTSGPGGTWCAFTSEFAPPAGTTPGPYSGTADILLTTPSVSIPVAISGTATASAAVTNTITWTAPASGYVGQVIDLSATSTAGYPVTFTTITLSYCTVAGSLTSGFTATFVGVGACSITASLPQCADTCQGAGSQSSTLYAAATPVVKSIAITAITATGKPAMLMTQTNSSFPNILGGGVLAGPISGGTSIGVGNNGYVAVSETYGGAVSLYNLAAGTVASLGSFSNPGGVAADSAGNLYIADQYNNQVAKLPYVSGAYAALTATSSTTPNCTSAATTECILAPIAGVSAIGGIGAMTFDSTGDLFLATDNNGTAKFSIWECTAACLSTGTPAPIEIYQEPISGTPVTTGQLYVGGLGVDPWGNLFFTDSNLVNQAISGPNNEATYSEVNELPTSTGAGFGGATTGYAAAPTLLQTYSNGCTPSTCGGYDDNLDALTVAPNGTIYYATLYDGVFAIPNTHTGGPMVVNQYPVSSSGAKVLGVDANGNVYEASSSLAVITINDLTVPTAQYLGPTVNAAAAVIDTADSYCSSTAPTFAFASTNPDFSATAGSTCSGLAIGSSFSSQSYASSFPATVYFNPLNPGAQTTTLTVSDTTNGGVGPATVSGLAQTTPQTVSFTAPTTTTYTYAAPPSPVTITLTVANGGSNFPAIFSVDASSTGAGTFSNGLTTMTGVVTGTNTSVVFTVTQAGTIKIDAYEPAGLASNHIYYSLSNTAQLALTINQASQTITFTPIVQSTYTYAPAPNQVTVQLSATGGATGNPVEFSIDSSSTGTGTITASTQVGTASLATLTVTGAGSIVLDASQAGNVDYSAASLTDAQTLTINQAAQTITLIPQTQPIHFIAASPGIAGGITVQVSAVGGGSDNPIVFTLDAASTMKGSFGASTVNGATSTALLTIPLQGSVVSGAIVIDATQAQSTDYAAVTDTPLGSINILAPLALQLITFNNPGTQVVATPLTLAATASSDLPVSYISTTTSVCKVVGAAVTFASETSASSCTIVASQLGDNITWAAAPPVTQSFTVNPTGQNPNFSLNLSLATLTIVPGTSGLTQLTVTSSDNFTGSLALTCSGLPSGYTCSFNPNPITIAEGGTATTTITVTPPTTAAMVRHDSRSLVPVTALGVALCFLGFRKRSRLQLLLVLALGLTALGALSACGGTASTTSTTKSATSTANITVTASGLAGASGSVSQSTTLTVIAE